VAVANDAVIVTAELPGAKPEDVTLSITGQTLTLRGARKPVHGGKPVAYHRQERSLGEFARSIELPDKVEGDKATADFEQGILTVRIPKAPEAVPRQIAVKAK
jgi:HSP20 family protein